MQAAADLVKAFLLPGSASFLLVCLTIGVTALRSLRTRRLAILFLSATTAAYWLGSLPVVAELLATRFHAAEAAPLPPSRLSGVEAIVVLGAGKRDYTVDRVTVSLADMQTTLNALEGARLYKAASGGLPVLVSGGGADETIDGVPVAGQHESELMKDTLIAAGVPAERIVLESQSTTTAEQARFSLPIIRAQNWRKIVLIAPAVQLPRAVPLFQAAQLEVVPAAAPFRSESTRMRAWLPSGGALNVTQRASYDYLGWVFYKLRGRIG